MVRFESPDNRAFAELQASEDGRLLLVENDGVQPTTFVTKDGFDAIQKLALLWSCKPEQIQYGPPHHEIRGIDDELEVVTFYNRHIFSAVNLEAQSQMENDLVAGFEVINGTVVPTWKPVVNHVVWPTFSTQEYYAFVRRIQDTFRVPVLTDGDEHPFMSTIGFDFSSVPLFHGDFIPHRTRGWELRYRHGGQYEVEVADQWSVYRIKQFVEQGMQKILTEYCEKMFAGHDETDVILIEGIADYERSIKVFALQNWNCWPDGAVPHYDAVYHGREAFLLVRIRQFAGGKIRCPKQLRGRVIGKHGVQINNMAKRHGINRLVLV